MGLKGKQPLSESYTVLASYESNLSLKVLVLYNRSTMKISNYAWK